MISEEGVDLMKSREDWLREYHSVLFWTIRVGIAVLVGLAVVFLK